MKKGIKCWDLFKCNEKECPVYISKESMCWLVEGTHCRDEIQGQFLEKIEMCLDCEAFTANVDADSIKETLEAVSEQFTEFARMVRDRDRELEGISIELAVGLSEVFEALKEISLGNPEVRVSEASEYELIAKLKHMVNTTAETLGEIALAFDVSVDQLLEINQINDPDELSSGMILDVPISGTPVQEPINESQADSQLEDQPAQTSTPLPIPENGKIKIITIVGVDDLADCHSCGN